MPAVRFHLGRQQVDGRLKLKAVLVLPIQVGLVGNKEGVIADQHPCA